MFTDDNGDSDDDNSSRFRSNWYFCGRQGGARGVITFSSELLFYKVPWTTSSPPPTAPTIPPMNKSFTQNTVLIKYVTEDFPPPKKTRDLGWVITQFIPKTFHDSQIFHIFIKEERLVPYSNQMSNDKQLQFHSLCKIDSLYT